MDCYHTLKLHECEKSLENNERVQKILILVIISFFILVAIGVIGFRYLFELNWLDSLYAAVLILTGIDLEATVITNGQKWFIIFYSILSIVIYLSMANTAIQYLFTLV